MNLVKPEVSHNLMVEVQCPGYADGIPAFYSVMFPVRFPTCWLSRQKYRLFFAGYLLGLCLKTAHN